MQSIETPIVSVPVSRRRSTLIVLIGMMLLLAGFFFIVPAKSVSAIAQIPSSFSIPYPTYQFSSWDGGGTSLTIGPSAFNDTAVQQRYLTTASAITPWLGYANWCEHANTTTTTISTSHFGVGNIYSPAEATLILKYQMSFFLQEPLDNGGGCASWAQDAIAYHPSLKTYNSIGKAVDNTRLTYVRVDDMNFAVQFYRDLVNLKNNLKVVTTFGDHTLLDYWHGIEVSSVSADGGDYPKSGPAAEYMLGNASVLNFAQSPLCANSITNLTYGACVYLANASQGIATSTGGHACCKTSVIYNQLILNFHPSQESDFTNAEFFLGMSYAAYNFSQKYMVHPFVIIPAFGIHIPTSQWPFPFNTAYIKGLDLLDKFVLGATANVENGGKSTPSTIASDEANCLMARHDSNTGFYLAGGTDTNYGSFVAATGEPLLLRNMMYLEAYCAATSMMMPSSIKYQPTYPSWPLMASFGGILNRMENIGNNQFGKVPITASDATTNVTLIGGIGKPLLAWFFTNRTISDSASITLIPSTYHLAMNCIAISALTWAVVGECSGDSLLLSSINIPARGWNPVYVMNGTSTNQILYSNMALANSGTTYLFRGPHLFSSWLIMKSASSPSSVSSNTTGPISQSASLSALNQTTVGMHWTGTTWQNLTQTGWYWDSAKSLLYVHFQTWNNEKYHTTEIKITASVPTTVTMTQTVTVFSTITTTVTQTATTTVTSTATVYSTVTMTVTTTRTTTRTCFIRCR